MAKEATLPNPKLKEVVGKLRASDQIITLAEMMVVCECLDPKIVINSLCGNGIFYSPDYGFFGGEVNPQIKEEAERVMRSYIDETNLEAGNEIGGRRVRVDDDRFIDETFGLGVKSGRIVGINKKKAVNHI